MILSQDLESPVLEPSPNGLWNSNKVEISLGSDVAKHSCHVWLARTERWKPVVETWIPAWPRFYSLGAFQVGFLPWGPRK
jgi:hypothetical protein